MSMAQRSLSLPVLHIMLALAGGAKHGYAIKQDVEKRTAGEIRLGPGTLYEAIQRLEDGGLIREAEGVEPENGQEAQRRYYRLTDRGWSTLRQEVRQLGLVVDQARAHPRLRKGLA
jgi:DNA-binding PadR family transcriptional regulator